MPSELFAISDVERMWTYLMIARDMERYAAEYYSRLAVRLDAPEFRDMAVDISMDEVEHLYLVGRTMGILESIAGPVDINTEYYEELKHASYVFPSMEEFGYTVDILTFLDTAISVEKKAVEFYETPLKYNIELDVLREVLEQMVVIEREHLDKIIAIKNSLLKRESDGSIPE